MPLYKWSQTSGNNAGADPTINYAEGQAPSSLNDSARAAMAAVAMYRDDIAGAIVTGGSSTAYTVASYSGFDTLAHMSGQMIAFSPHVTNGATVLLNVDGLGQKPLRSSPGVELLAGTIIQGTPYVATYNNSDGAFYLHGFYPAPTTFNIPLAGGMDFWGSTVPNSSFAFPIGQAISRATYATLFAIMGTTYGSGDGSTTFNIPNKTGRVSAMQEASATLLTSTYFGGNSTVLGATGGLESHLLTTPEIPAHNHGVNDPQHGHAFPVENNVGATLAAAAAAGPGSPGDANTRVSSTGITIQNAGGGGAHANVQPTIICNYILRII